MNENEMTREAVRLQLDNTSRDMLTFSRHDVIALLIWIDDLEQQLTTQQETLDLKADWIEPIDLFPKTLSNCPNCGSNDLNCTDTTHEDELIIRTYDCQHCRVSWSETYRFTQWVYN